MAFLLAGFSAEPIWAAEAEDAATIQTVPAATTEAELDEIVVTARRRSEALQRTPVSVIALSESDLEARSLTNLRTLQNFVPNLTFAPSQNVGEAAGNVFIRGIGQEDFSVGAEPGVGLYVDGVYLARTFGTLMNLTDIERIEVLRGPQGTLFGKNTIGGAINIVSRMPGPLREGRSSILIGNYDRVELRGTFNEPVSGNLLLRMSALLASRDGYLRRLPPPAPIGLVERANGAPVNSRREGSQRSQSARLQLRWLATETLTADLSLDGSRTRGSQGATHIDAINPDAGTIRQLNRLIGQGALPGPQITGAFAPESFLDSYAAGHDRTSQDFWGLSLVLTKEMDATVLKFIGAYRGLRSRIQTDTDGLYFNITESDLRIGQRQFSGELQLTGRAGGLSYTAGLFALREESDVNPAVFIINQVLYSCGCFYTPGALPRFSIVPRQLSGESYAAYAQGTQRITGKLSATLGARYSYERKTIDGRAFRLDVDLQPTDILVATGANKDSWNSLTYRAGLEYQATRNLMAYLSVAKGYKSGGFNARAAPDLPNLGFTSYKPETARTHELGLRSEWLGRRLRFNTTVFHTSYKNIQLRQQTITGGVVTTLIENAARARIRGVELELAALPFEGLTLTAAYGHLAPRYLDVGRVPDLTLASRFQRTVSHSLSTSISYAMSLEFATLELRADYSYRSKEQFQIVPALNDQKGYGLLGARITLESGDKHWSLAVFGSNLTDKRYRTAGRGTQFDQVGIAFSSVGMPRQLGIQMSTKF